MARTIDLRAKKEEPKSEVHSQEYIAAPAQYSSPTPIAAPVQLEPRFVETEREPDSVKWQGSMRHHHPNIKAVASFVVGLFALGILTYIFQQNTFAAVLFILMGLVLILHVKRDMEICEFEVNYQGLRRENQLISYREIESFWMDYLPDHNIKEISVHLKKKHMPYLKIPLHDQDPVQVRTIMIQFLPEVEHKDGLSEVIARKLGI